MRPHAALVAGLAMCAAVSVPSAPALHDAANNPRRTEPLPPVDPGRWYGRSVLPPTTAPGQSARRKRRLARHGKTV